MSDDFDSSSTLSDGQARVAQIVAGAMQAGVTLFACIAIVVRISAKKGLFAPEPWKVLPPDGLISLIALVVAATVLVLSFIVPNASVVATRRTIAKQPDSDRPLKNQFDSLYMNQMIIGIALLEGGAFFNLIAFMIEGHIPNLIAVLVLLLLMMSRFPSKSRLEMFAQDQEALLIEERQSA